MKYYILLYRFVFTGFCRISASSRKGARSTDCFFCRLKPVGCRTQKMWTLFLPFFSLISAIVPEISKTNEPSGWSEMEGKEKEANYFAAGLSLVRTLRSSSRGRRVFIFFLVSNLIFLFFFFCTCTGPAAVFIAEWPVAWRGIVFLFAAL